MTYRQCLNIGEIPKQRSETNQGHYCNLTGQKFTDLCAHNRFILQLRVDGAPRRKFFSKTAEHLAMRDIHAD